MAKSADAFRTISEVAEWLDTPAHVLRFWESKFSHVKPVKRAGGRRYYRPSDMKLLGGIKKLLHDDGLTIKGVQKLLREQGVAHVSYLSQPLGDAADDVTIEGVVTAQEPKVVPKAPGTPDAPQIETVDASEPTISDPVDRVEPINPATETTPVVEPSEDTDEPVEDTLVLPSFQHRRQAETTDTEPASTAPEPEEHVATPPIPEPTLGRAAQPESAATQTQVAEAPATPEPEPQPLRPDVVDVPDDPTDMIGVAPGVLSRLSKLPQPLPASIAAELKPLLDRLNAAVAPRPHD